MKKILLIMLLISKNYTIAQKTPEDFGYRQMSFKFQDDKVDLIIISKKGEEKKEGRREREGNNVLERVVKVRKMQYKKRLLRRRRRIKKENRCSRS